MENGAQSEGKDPSSFLSDIIGNPVIVKLNSGVVYKGKGLRSLLSVSGMLGRRDELERKASWNMH